MENEVEQMKTKKRHFPILDLGRRENPSNHFHGHELPPCRFDYDRAGQYRISQNFVTSIGDQLNVDSINEKVQIRNH